MGKYIIDLESGTHIFMLGPEGIVHIGEPDVVYETVDGMQIGDAIINAKPYTEPDLEQVRKEAYQKGYETGYEDGYNEPGKNQQEVYQRGLSDAWEAARKISLAKIDGGFSWESMNDIFGTESPNKIYKTLTATEAIEKIRQYEQEQEEIKVGDEVLAPFGTAVVTNIVDDKIWFCYADGHCGFDYKKDKPRKTGRHFPEIATILENMRGEQDG